jgi:hypothetical protein
VIISIVVNSTLEIFDRYNTIDAEDALGAVSGFGSYVLRSYMGIFLRRKPLEFVEAPGQNGRCRFSSRKAGSTGSCLTVKGRLIGYAISI